MPSVGDSPQIIPVHAGSLLNVCLQNWPIVFFPFIKLSVQSYHFLNCVSRSSLLWKQYKKLPTVYKIHPWKVKVIKKMLKEFFKTKDFCIFIQYSIYTVITVYTYYVYTISRCVQIFDWYWTVLYYTVLIFDKHFLLKKLGVRYKYILDKNPFHCWSPTHI